MLRRVGRCNEWHLVFRKPLQNLTFRFVSWDGERDVVFVSSFDSPGFNSFWPIGDSMFNYRFKKLFVVQPPR